MKQADQTIAMTLMRAQFWGIDQNIDFNHCQLKFTQMLLATFFGKRTFLYMQR
ncbi:hypothetical protein [Flavobacterium sp. SOK18b]|uniref:hypothetical protein n=1 Tax=Flavobacterium sp. SOK18b TaxID=797900 RepID=UPI0015FC0A57|nr:hypothetical protein [Flavobacterium sp. SOK18b]